MRIPNGESFFILLKSYNSSLLLKLINDRNHRYNLLFNRNEKELLPDTCMRFPFTAENERRQSVSYSSRVSNNIPNPKWNLNYIPRARACARKIVCLPRRSINTDHFFWIVIEPWRRQRTALLLSSITTAPRSASFYSRYRRNGNIRSRDDVHVCGIRAACVHAYMHIRAQYTRSPLNPPLARSVSLRS